MIFQEIRGFLASFIEIILKSLGLFGKVVGESIDILQRTWNSSFQSVRFKVNSFKYVCIHSIKIIKLIETQYLINILFYYYSLGINNKTLYWRWKGIQRKLDWRVQRYYWSNAEFCFQLFVRGIFYDWFEKGYYSIFCLHSFNRKDIFMQRVDSIFNKSLNFTIITICIGSLFFFGMPDEASEMIKFFIEGFFQCSEMFNIVLEVTLFF